ncbi:helix-turn-helix domain-containing protein [Tistrella mobilis]|nr:helix-turn-helix transcriptional regulator [Tistrella mobilis]
MSNKNMHRDACAMGELARRVDNFVGERIRLRRTLLGMTQEHLAAALDISYQQVQKYETGLNRVSAGRLYEISTKLGVPVAFFFDGLEEIADSIDPDAPKEHGGKNRSTIELVRYFTDITDQTLRTAIIRLIKALAEGNGQRGERSDDLDMTDLMDDDRPH